RYGHPPGRSVVKVQSMISADEKMQTILAPLPKLTLPFPPQINAEDLFTTSKLPSKPPNAFFIYRKVYTKELITQNFRFKMTDVSPLVSSSWKLESDEVKTKYKEIARDVRQIYKKKKTSIEVEDSSDETASKNDDSQTIEKQETTSISSSNQNELTEERSPLTPEELLSTPEMSQEDDLPEPWVNSDFPSSNFFSPQEIGSDNDMPINFIENVNIESSYSDYFNFISPPNYHPQIPINDQPFTEPWTHDLNFLLDLDVLSVSENQF
ncbi:12218_t:CDS:1, partial [Acaulospora morrowiae]